MKNLADRIRVLSHPMEPVSTGEEARLASMGGIRAVLFDIYGTMLISGSGDVGTAAATDSAAALKDALRDAGYELIAEESVGVRGIELLGEAIGASHAESRRDGVAWPEVDILQVWEMVVGRMCSEGLLTGEVDEEALKRLGVEYECRVNPVWPMPGLLKTLGGLKTAGMRLGVVSNAQFYTPILFSGLLGVELLDLGFEEDLCVWSYLERQGKPSASLFAKAIGRLRDIYGILPSETLYVGNDMRNDIAAAFRAGCRTALFAGDSRSLRWREGDPLCTGVKPDLVLAELSQLLAIVFRL